MRIMKSALIVVACMAISACSTSDQRGKKLNAAASVVSRQLARDIETQIDWQKALVTSTSGGFFYVCGEALLNRPNAGVLTLNNVRQRFIVTVNASTKDGSALFDGSRDQGGQYVFEATWRDKCSGAR